MTLVDVLEVIPDNATYAAGRQSLKDMLGSILPAVTRFQDSASGRWFQLVIRGSDSRNWTETSCSAMYTDVLSRATDSAHQYVSDPNGTFAAAAAKGFDGVKARISSTFSVSQICVGTNVSDLETYYFDRTRATNDLHGVGAVAIMAEHLQHPPT
jgi:unsaturated rhamnogalacturonyl hydrolase